MIFLYILLLKKETLITLSNDNNFVASESRKTGNIFHCLNCLIASAFWISWTNNNGKGNSFMIILAPA